MQVTNCTCLTGLQTSCKSSPVNNKKPHVGYTQTDTHFGFVTFLGTLHRHTLYCTHTVFSITENF